MARKDSGFATVNFASGAFEANCNAVSLKIEHDGDVYSIIKGNDVIGQCIPFSNCDVNVEFNSAITKLVGRSIDFNFSKYYISTNPLVVDYERLQRDLMSIIAAIDKEQTPSESDSMEDNQ